MTVSIFLMLLSFYSVLNGLIVEAIKRIVEDKKNISYNLTAIISAIIISGIGTAIYYQLNEITFSLNNVIYIILMGFSSGLVSMVGYDKVSQLISQLVNKRFTGED